MSIVVLDVDGVLADFVLGFREWAHERFGIPVFGTRNQAQWAISDLTDEQQKEIWESLDEEFWLNLPSLVTKEEWGLLGHVAGIHDVYFVTNRFHPLAKQHTEKWLGHCLPLPTVILSSRKGDIARAVQANFLLDDKAGNAVYTTYASPDTRVYLLDRAYNQFDHSVMGSRVNRVQTVKEFLDIVERAQ